MLHHYLSDRNTSIAPPLWPFWRTIHNVVEYVSIGSLYIWVTITAICHRIGHHGGLLHCMETYIAWKPRWPFTLHWILGNKASYWKCTWHDGKLFQLKIGLWRLEKVGEDCRRMEKVSKVPNTNLSVPGSMALQCDSVMEPRLQF